MSVVPDSDCVVYHEISKLLLLSFSKCHAMPCYVMSCHVVMLSCHVVMLSCHMLSCCHAAASYYKLAADQGDKESQYCLGYAYASGKGVEEDMEDGA
jgi:TPR repeat protein